MDVAKLFKSRTRRELFRLYFTDPEGEFYLRDLERILGIPVSMIRKEVVSLKEEGLLVERTSGNRSYYRLNKEYPLYEEFKSIVEKTIGVAGLLTACLVNIKGIAVSFLFGSFARNMADGKSDIDVFIIGAPDEMTLVKEFGVLEKKLRREINFVLYDESQFRNKARKNDAFVADVLAQPKVFLKGDLNDLRKIHPGIS